ncbi:MAG: TIGR02996 domain-containing protein, partial [Gemmataceae bacterium]|nr:TIGR02996 domain-containing protein [Gemmataceae bacterium]
MTTDGDALLRAICENPGEDTPRLVYADWLDENGDPERAEFIRLQCALDAGDPFAPDRWSLLRREWNLLRRYGERWVRDDGLSDLVAGESLWHYPPNIRFRRGFLDRFWVNSPEEFERKAPILFARAPVTGVRLWAPYTVGSSEGQWFQNTFTNIWNANCARRLSGFPHQPLVQPGGTAFPEPDEFRRLVGGESFARLRSFAMDTIDSDRRHIEILAPGPAAAGLQELDLSGNALIEDDGWAV